MTTNVLPYQPAATAMYELVEVIQKNAPPMPAALRHVPVGDANARRPAPNPAGCPAWARSRQPRYWAWDAAGLVGNDPRHRRPCRRPKRRSHRVGNGVSIPIPPFGCATVVSQRAVFINHLWSEPVGSPTRIPCRAEPSPPRQHEVGRRGTPMDDALRPVDLDHCPVRVHGDDPAAGDAPQQTGAVQVVQRAR